MIPNIYTHGLQKEIATPQPLVRTICKKPFPSKQEKRKERGRERERVRERHTERQRETEKVKELVEFLVQVALGTSEPGTIWPPFHKKSQMKAIEWGEYQTRERREKKPNPSEPQLS